jgi:hypothetical protein
VNPERAIISCTMAGLTNRAVVSAATNGKPEPGQGIEYVQHQLISLKSHPVLNEVWVHERIRENPVLLGLGDVDVRDFERRQPGAGRLDLLLHDPTANLRYEVEVQLGQTDEAHIIRTIEYWDIERRRYPQYDHCAVLVAEDITSRFLNVIALFNGHIPLIAIRLSAIAVAGKVTLMATTVMDQMSLGTDEEDEPQEPTDRKYWEGRATPGTLRIVDSMLGFVHEVTPQVDAKYNKYYIGLAQNGVVNNFVHFKPRKRNVIVVFKVPKSEELLLRLTDAGLDVLDYDNRWKQLPIRIDQDDIQAHPDLIKELVQQAYQASGR